MDKNVEDIICKSQYGQKRRGYPSQILGWRKTLRISLVNFSMDKNAEDITSKPQYGQNRSGYPS